MARFQRFCNVFRPGRLQSDLERELAFHVSERVEELRESGLSQAEAARAARLQFGNFTNQLERTRDMDINAWLESTVRNLRHSMRVLAKTPAFTITVILTLALGIGANSAVFSAIYAVLLRPLPFPNADELVKLAQSQPKIPQAGVAPVRLEELEQPQQHLPGDHRVLYGRYFGDLRRASRETQARAGGTPLPPSAGNLSATGARFHFPGRTIRRTGRRAHQLPPVAAALRRRPERYRQDIASSARPPTRSSASCRLRSNFPIVMWMSGGRCLRTRHMHRTERPHFSRQSAASNQP